MEPGHPLALTTAILIENNTAVPITEFLKTLTTV